MVEFICLVRSLQARCEHTIVSMFVFFSYFKYKSVESVSMVLRVLLSLCVCSSSECELNCVCCVDQQPRISLWSQQTRREANVQTPQKHVKQLITRRSELEFKLELISRRKPQGFL